MWLVKTCKKWLVNYLEKCFLFIFQYSFKFSWSTADLLKVLSDRIATAFNNSGVTRAAAFDISKVFGNVCRVGLLPQVTSFRNFRSGIWPYILLFPFFLRNRQLRVILYGKSSQEYPLNAGVLQGSNIGPTFFLLYTFMSILMMLSVILLFRVMILLSTLSLIRHLTCDNS